MELLPYYFFFFFMFVLYNKMMEQTAIQLEEKTDKIQFLFWVMFALWIIVGTRNVLYGRDTLGYVQHFKNITSLELLGNSEPLFVLFEYIVRKITGNYHIYLMLASVGMCLSLYYLMKRYFSDSYEIIAAICVYVLLGLLAFNMAALRQTIALSLAVFAFLAADDGKWKRFIILVVCAYLFHNSSWVVIFLYPLRYINVKKWGIVIVAIFFTIGVVAPDLVVPFMQSFNPNDRFASYGTVYESSQNYVGFALQLILIIIVYIRRDYIYLEEKTQNLFFSAAYIGISIQSLTVALAELYRLSFYFCVFDIVLVPIALSSYNGTDNEKIVKGCFIIGCLVYIFLLSGGGVLPLKEHYLLAF